MARIAGVTLPSQKRTIIALQYIYGVGATRAVDVLNRAKVDGDIRVKDLSPEQENAIRVIVEKEFRVEGELRREVLGNVKRLKDIAAYRGLRHMKNLPVRGQRTKTNSRTVRGNVRKTAGSGRRIATKT
ncbi:MAG: 30S ribosomal protein S13 [Candidatus Uhrbacteria bacterium GW2011_GWD2_52_7]|uniref:Small ribosomal subunit protein uS13 n=1 Tax=Candidatus Uhrbacteria bacterium GW2011_GWD2_52_7 TaxID=1618989 RepID=A0A0G1XFJ0_9BACT|nr:MAG: 30S ribosomal protein S13 [Candidatus Uhrbacteria bacterium GW2011_GWD2_52_7]